MSRALCVTAVIASLAIGYQFGRDSREPEITDLMHTAEHGSLEIEALGEEVKKCRKTTGATP